MQILILMFFFLLSLSFQENFDKSILLGLKQHWRNSEFMQLWDLNSSACSWPGVSCINDKVTDLKLREKNITGTIPSTICLLNNLTLINLSRNMISGTIPVSFKDCSKLHHLDLSNNFLRDRIPGELFRMKSLINLYLNGNMFSGELPSSISLPQLENLYLSHNSLTGSITNQLFQLHRLRHLSLSYNYLSGVIPDTMDLYELYDMDLSHNQLTGSIPKGLGNLHGLNALDLSHNKLSGEISEIIKYLKPRNTLRLCSNKFSGRISADLVVSTYEENCFDEFNLSMKRSISGIRESSRPKHLIIIIPIVGVGIVIQLIWIFYMAVRDDWWKRIYISMQPWWKTKKHKIRRDLKFISFQKIKVSADDVLSSLKDENVIGHGGSGKVYRVVIDQTGSTYAVKSIEHDNKTGARPQKEFLAEVRTLGIIRHYNIVKLMCCVSSPDRNLLVYEYFDRQSLDKWLHRKKTPVLDWPKRLKIATGAAQGLGYMHHDCTRPIIHRDIKSSNILLDSEFNAKIADFGLAKILTKGNDDPETASAIAGTFGYIAPEYGSTFRVNVKTDIYSFGVVLLELTTGREAIIRDEQMNLAQWAQQHYREGSCILDEEITEASHLEQMTNVFKLGLMCTRASPSGRPSMKEVCYILQDNINI